MGLAQNSPVGFIPTTKPEAARAFYEKTLGLRFESADDFAIVFRAWTRGHHAARDDCAGVYAQSFTIFGWQVDDIVSNVTELAAKGVEFTRYGFMEQDDRGIWNAPGGTKVAWFKDPDGNTLSLSQHPA